MFADRGEAARVLVQKLREDFELSELGEGVVCGVFGGGVVMGSALAQTFDMDLEVLGARRIVFPEVSQLPLGSTSLSRRSLVYNFRLGKELGIGSEAIRKKIVSLQDDLQSELSYVREKRNKVYLKNRLVVLVDEGVASGDTMISVARHIWGFEPRKLVVAVPVVSRGALEKLEKEVDGVYFLQAPEDFYEVSQWYRHFPKIKEAEIQSLLNGTRNRV